MRKLYGVRRGGGGACTPGIIYVWHACALCFSSADLSSGIDVDSGGSSSGGGSDDKGHSQEHVQPLEAHFRCESKRQT